MTVETMPGVGLACTSGAVEVRDSISSKVHKKVQLWHSPQSGEETNGNINPAISGFPNRKTGNLHPIWRIQSTLKLLETFLEDNTGDTGNRMCHGGCSTKSE